ncbi:MAG: MerC domain-containing protein [Betaproteobacteria bacterium]|nr:MerC domain-containing protein [Betaproteobacteria bacterium]
MKEFIKQCGSTAGAAFAGACCLGVTGALSILTAVGAGFLINDAFLVPLYLGLLALSVWLLYSSARSHGNLMPFWTGLAGALVAFAGLWILPALVYAGLAVLIAGSVWDFWNARAARAISRQLH